MPTRAVTAFLIIIGCMLLFVPIYNGAEGDRYFVDVIQTDSPDGDIQSYEELPPDAQETFDEAQDEGRVFLNEHSDRHIIEALQSVEHVRVDGEYYSVYVDAEVNDSTFGEFLDQFLITPVKLVGGLSLGYAIVTTQDKDWQPDTLTRVGKLIAVTGICGVIGIIVTIYIGSNGLFLTQLIEESILHLGVFLITIVPFLTGGALKQRNWRLVGLSLLPILALLLLSGLAPSFFFVLLYVFLIGGGLLGIGYEITEP